jgi:acylphosphatase
LSEHVRRRIVARGRVQNVWFRDSCRVEAQAHDVVGWVCNRLDGSVEAVFEGTPAAVARMVEWCRSGPPGARVDSLEVSAEPVRGETGFVIR